jgi:NAD(P)-dependent dehydrogenase (short-subunit alcohol dehydrogenase family)
MRAIMQTLGQKCVLIIGGSRGLDLGVVEALVARHADVTVMARDSASLAGLKDRLAVSIIAGDSNAWGSYINCSLRSLITTGKGRPNPKEKRRAVAAG